MTAALTHTNTYVFVLVTICGKDRAPSKGLTQGVFLHSQTSGSIAPSTWVVTQLRGPTCLLST